MSAISKYLGYQFAINMQKPFTEWDAFKFGLIDAKGEKLRTPVTKEERESFLGIMNVIRKIKKIVVKYVGDSALTRYMIAAYLLKESEGDEYADFRNEVRESLTEAEYIKYEVCIRAISEMSSHKGDA